MTERAFLTGNKATAYGAMYARVQVVAAYPITPQTTIVERIADLVAEGKMEAKYVKVESEHSAMAAAVAASNTGVRAFTATSSHGLALMHEVLMWAAGARTPVVLVNVNRAMGPPWSVWADHQDAMAERDSGVIQFWCENNQEIFDTIPMAFKVAENKDILLPAMINQDAFFLSHTSEPVQLPDQEVVDEFLPPYHGKYRLDVDDPKGFGSLVMPPQYMEFRAHMARSMNKAREIIKKVDREWEEITGRSYGGMMDLYRCEDAEFVLFGAGTMMSTAKDVVDELRKEGRKVGVARLRVFRPFPIDEIRYLADRVLALGVLDRTYTFGQGGPLFNEANAQMYNYNHRPPTKNYVIGVGGRDVQPKHIRSVFDDLEKVSKEGYGEEGEIHWWGLLDDDIPEVEK
ncbi:MAG: transketolase C-terminal domain-containing protein [Candidatus Thermoplasmatota archaeon]|nr:transketolase C-terminal domain-containing protein [Candidatus Thermoplasmatota archaeon]